jgi:hypothetical protein
VKFVRPLIFFLDEDLHKSAQMLTNKYLETNIKNCCQVLVCSLLHMVGIRNKKACKYYFSKENKRESLQKFFPTWPLKESPKFVKYNSEESRWCRKCKNHYDVILNYLEELLNEYSFRFGHDHDLYEMLDFLKMEQYHISLRMGIHVVYVKNLKIVLPWKNLPLKFRKRDIIAGYKAYYKSILIDPFFEYERSKRSIPEYIFDGNCIEEVHQSPSIV